MELGRLDGREASGRPSRLEPAPAVGSLVVDDRCLSRTSAFRGGSDDEMGGGSRYLFGAGRGKCR